MKLPVMEVQKLLTKTNWMRRRIRTYYIAHAVITNSFRRPGAVIIITIKEFEQAKKETSTGQEEMATK